jgi:hypothetical protein
MLKQKLQIFLSAGITTLIVAGVVGATTIGTNISTEGDLSVAGSADIDNDVFTNLSSISIDQKILNNSLPVSAYRTSGGWWSSVNLFYDIDGNSIQTIDSPFNFGTDNFTVVWQGKFNEIDKYNPFLSKYQNWTTPGWRMDVSAANVFQFVFA